MNKRNSRSETYDKNDIESAPTFEKPGRASLFEQVR